MKVLYIKKKDGKRYRVNVPSYVESAGQGQEPDILSPFFVRQPTDLTVAEGETADFSVVAAPDSGLTGNPKYWLKYNWYSSSNAPVTEGGQFTGTTTSTLSVLGNDMPDSGSQYYCQITNASGSVTSSLVTLYVESGGNSLWNNDSMDFDTEPDNWETA